MAKIDWPFVSVGLLAAGSLLGFVGAVELAEHQHPPATTPTSKLSQNGNNQCRYDSWWPAGKSDVRIAYHYELPTRDGAPCARSLDQWVTRDTPGATYVPTHYERMSG